MGAIKDILQRIRNDRTKMQGTWIGIDESHIILNAIEKSERIEAEVAELRARLEKAVELPYMYEAELVDSAGHFFKTIYIVLCNNNGTIRAIQYSYKKVAEARLKKLQGGKK